MANVKVDVTDDGAYITLTLEDGCIPDPVLEICKYRWFNRYPGWMRNVMKHSRTVMEVSIDPSDFASWASEHNTWPKSLTAAAALCEDLADMLKWAS